MVQNRRFILRGKFCCFGADSGGSVKAIVLPAGSSGPQSPCSLQLNPVHGCNFNLILLLENKTDRHQKKNKEKIAACHKYFTSFAACHVITSKCLILDAIRLKKRQQAVFFLFDSVGIFNSKGNSRNHKPYMNYILHNNTIILLPYSVRLIYNYSELSKESLYKLHFLFLL